ncbi:MAG: Dabb family protein [Rhodoblastus sp.]|nr:MAG: Dabb family protein [Rhodoblastus sp.]
MIRHIVFFTAKSPDDLDAIMAGLSVLTTIPHARKLEIARNAKADPFGNEIDVIVYGEFDDEAALAAYKNHPTYAESIRRVRPIRELRFAAHYETSAALTEASAAG